MTRATSRHNPRLAAAARLLASSRDRRKSGRCVLEGEHLAAVYWDRHGPPETLIVSEDATRRDAVQRLIARDPAHALIVPVATFSELATLPADVGVLAVVPTPTPQIGPAGDFCVLLEDLQDPGNVGSILRSAAAAGVQHVLMSKHCAFAWSPKVLRAAQGAHFMLEIYEDVDLAAWARAYAEAGGRVVVTSVKGGEPLYSVPLAGRVAFAFGNEGAGVTQALARAATSHATIPMPGGMESLNAAAAAAVCLFEAVRQRSAGGGAHRAS